MGEEHCHSAVCHRISFLYAPLYEHDQLNALTHDAGLAEMFGVASTSMFQHLSTMIRAGTVVGADGSDRYMPNAASLSLPMTFIHGAENACFLPASTERTVEVLAVQRPEMVSTRNHSELRPYRLHLRQKRSQGRVPEDPSGTGAHRGAMTTVAKHWDAIVVGSGFGGSIAAYRLAKAGRRVLVLERGRRYATNDFPRDATDIDALFWCRKGRRYTAGLYDLRFFSDIGCVVAAGVGAARCVRQHPHSSGPGGVRRSALADRDRPDRPDPYYDRVADVRGGPGPSRGQPSEAERLPRGRHTARPRSVRSRPGGSVARGSHVDERAGEPVPVLGRM